MSRFKRSNRLGLEGLRDIVDDQIKLHDEFQRIPINNADPNSLPPNVNHKNRYVNILPNKESRVPLEQVGDDTTSTYINANYVRGDLGAPNVYVCTQGPLPQTVIDFWRLMWELKSPVIVMATALEERGKQKCARYWPDASVAPRVKYGDIVVSVVREEATDVYDFTELAVSLGGEERHIGHFWFRAWPDHGVPKNTKAILTFLAAVRSYDAESPLKGPQVIHCSAGIGRTGTFSAVDIGMRSLDRTGSVDVLNIVARLREDRGGMVQTQEQYCFIYESLLDYLESKSD